MLCCSNIGLATFNTTGSDAVRITGSNRRVRMTPPLPDDHPNSAHVFSSCSHCTYFSSVVISRVLIYVFVSFFSCFCPFPWQLQGLRLTLLSPVHVCLFVPNPTPTPNPTPHLSSDGVQNRKFFQLRTSFLSL
jgi:hypothetical protein